MTFQKTSIIPTCFARHVVLIDDYRLLFFLLVFEYVCSINEERFRSTYNLRVGAL